MSLKDIFPSTPSVLASVLLTLFVSGSAPQPASAAEPRIAVQNSAAATPALRGARLVGHLASAQTLSVGLTLPLRNQSKLDTLLRRMYTRGDALYGKFLTPAEFDAQFAPSVEDYSAVAAFARSQGLSVTGTQVGRTLLTVSGPVSTVETALGVRLGQYQMRDGRTVYANAMAPRLPGNIAVRLAGVAGLSNLSQMRPHTHLFSSRRPGVRALTPLPGTTAIGSGPNGGLAPNDVKYAYSLDTLTALYPGPATSTGTSGTATTLPLDGTGQTVGLFELDSYDPKDILLYVNQFSLPTVLTATATTPSVLQNVLLGGYDGKIINRSGQGEVTLDIDMVLALAPNLTNLYVYQANQVTNTNAALTVFNRMASDTGVDGKPLLKVISCSWGVPELEEDPAIRSGEDTAFRKMAAQGQSVFCSAGDQGAYDNYASATPLVYSLSVDNPASQPYATGVGGTTLKYNKPVPSSATVPIAKPGMYVSESTWNVSAPASLAGPEGGGGGVSAVWAKPIYQAGLGSSPTNRDVPDVSLNANPDTGYDIYVTGKVETDGGTSAAAPLWAAFAALVNQQRALNGLGTLGFANQPLYAIANGPNYSTEFHDIADGKTNLYYQAIPGYDDATGIGSFVGDKLLANLSFNPDQGTTTASLTGIVTNTSGIALVGATINVTSSVTGGLKGTTVTDGNGAYSLTVPGNLSLNISVDPSTIAASPVTLTTTNYTGATSFRVTAIGGGSLVQNFVLTAAHPFVAGLQMISAPFDYTSSGGDFAALFGLTPPLRSPSPRLIQWQPDLNVYVFYPTSPADTLRPGQAYWIKFPAPAFIHLPGVAVPTSQSFQITLKPGWNQIGDPFQSPAPLSGMTVDVPTGGYSGVIATSQLVQPTLYRYNMASGQYDTLSSTTDSLQPYDGVWIYARTTVVLSIPPQNAPPTLPLARP